MTNGPGAKARDNREEAEEVLYGLLVRRRYFVRRHEVVGESIAETPLKASLYIRPCERFPEGLIVEPRYQAVKGSIDHKLAYLWCNVHFGCYPYPIAVVLMGGGQAEGISNWLRGQVDGKHLIGVFTQEEFKQWV